VSSLTATVNSVHHQGVRTLGRDLRVEARSMPDGIVEAVRYEPADASGATPFIYAVQWHPEFQDPADSSLLPGAAVREMFLEAAEARRDRRSAGEMHAASH
jgi:putative glutamine amidotransferase